MILPSAVLPKVRSWGDPVEERQGGQQVYSSLGATASYTPETSSMPWEDYVAHKVLSLIRIR